MQEPIGALHRLTYRKITIGEERERNFIRHFSERFGPAAQETMDAARAPYPPIRSETRLEDLVGAEPVHATLESIAARQAEREAATLGALLRRFGDEAEVEIRMSAYDHGWRTGDRIARVRGEGPPGPAEAFDLLADHYPDGLACCPSIRLLEEDSRSVRWAQYGPEALEAWSRMNVPAEVMCSMVAFWCKGFGEALNPDLRYLRGKSLATGDPYLEGLFRLEAEEDAGEGPPAA